ncbi:hypothetical protein HYZ97_02945 [Candidatus Pacearchaeota archaeon]|nr:hypothetical protein [Candidatus Pacearchaeota archaeon]
MKFNFKKIASVLAGTVMMSSTLAFAAAANYPAPFVKNGNADVAVVYGSQPGAEFDLLAVADITQNLQASLAKQTASTGSSTSASVSGEASPLFTGSTKIYVNDTLDAVKNTLTETELPNLLKDGNFNGNVDATYTQTIVLGSNPQLIFAKQPSSSDDPDFGFSLSTSTTNYVYNASVTFNKAVAFNHSDSEGQDITMFGQKFTIGSATDNTNLVLLKSAEKISLSSDNPSGKVTISGKEYTIELVSASDTSATVKVTDADGNSDTKEVSENSTKKIQGLTVAITNADENNLKYTASIIAGAEKVTLTSGSSVTMGENDDVIDGTKVTFTNTNGVSDITKIVVSIAASNSDKDAIKAGSIFTDPVFGSFKLDFASINYPMDSTARENIAIKNSGDDKLELTMTEHRGNLKTNQFVKNYTAGAPQLQGDNDGRNITVFEEQAHYRNEFVVVGNEDEGYLLKLSSVTNQTTGYSQDKVKYQDVFSGDTYEATLTAEGTGTVTIGGKVYDVAYSGDASASEDARSVTLNYPDSSGGNTAVIYPTIQTSKGAKLAFYEPTLINVSAWDRNNANLNAYNNLTTLRFPDGDGYTDVALINYELGNFSVGGVTLGNGTNHASAVIGKLNYTFAYAGDDYMNVSLANPQGMARIAQPAIVVFEEKDDNSDYQAIVVTMEEGGTSDDGIGVNDVVRTWHADATWDSISLASNSKIEKEADLFGVVVTVDKSDSDQNTATISYPDEQVYALVYVAEDAASIDAGTVSSGTVKELGSVAVKDTEVAQVSTKNLIVVGGSCVNTLASQLLNGAGCGPSFEQATGVGSGSFLIQTFARTGDKVATLVAGYHVDDTRNAAKALTTQVIDTSVGKKYKSTSATTVALESSTTAAVSTGNATA